MGLQDLTPQLRTRLSRVERAVGVFVTVATLLLLAGLFYYIFHTAQRKGWFDIKVAYSTSLNNATGLKPGDPVKLMGFNVGQILEVKPNEPGSWYGVTIYFEVREPYFGYIWLDSKVRVAAVDFLGNRSVEIVKGLNGEPSVVGKTKKDMLVLNSDFVQTKIKDLKADLRKTVQSNNADFNDYAISMEMEQGFPSVTNAVNALIKNQPSVFYTTLEKAKTYWIEPLESPALTERLESLVNGLESALPNILNLTNQIAAVLENTAGATKKLDAILVTAEPMVSNLVFISSNLRDPQGSLGDWLFPTNLNAELDRTLKTTRATLTNTDSNLTSLVTNVNRTLENLANVTSNLNAQVQANTNILSNVSDAVVHSDELVQGLKRHWFLRSTFKKKKEESAAPPKVFRAPRDNER